MLRRMDGRPVYSTDPGFVPPCTTCGEPPGSCRCAPPPAPPPPEQSPRVRLETKGRGGKAVTVVEGVLGSEGELKEIARWLKGICGSGGTLKEGLIELQGDHRDKVVAALAGKGYRAKKGK